MYIIGELINGMYQKIGRAIKEKDKRVIQECALAQINAGSDALDINCGPASRNPLADIQWLIEAVQEVTDKPLCLDSSNPRVIEAALKVCRNKVMVNSTTADKEKLDTIIPLAKAYQAKLIGIAIDSSGIPKNKDQRLELAAGIVASCLEKDFPLDDLYLDPIVLPVNVAQSQMKDILESIKEFKIISEPAPKTIIGLSNVSQATTERSLLNRIFLVMALVSGLDAAILDPLDKPLMDAAISAELILNKQIYCNSFLDAYRKKG